jgi:hypothetical protein
MANIAVAEQRGCSDPQVKKILGVTSDVLWDVGRGVRILTKKTNYITRLKTARRIY